MIRYLHYRPYEKGPDKLVAAGKGGVTVAYTEDEGGETISFGIAQCNEVDNFSRPLGRTIARGRLNVKPEAFIGDYVAFIKYMDDTWNPVPYFRAQQIFNR